MCEDSTGERVEAFASDPPAHWPALEEIEELATRLLSAIGEDLTRPGLIDTPRRWANWWSEFINYDPGNVDVTFEAVTVDQMVVVSGIRVYSLCEHHLLPFWCDISISYITADKVLGLSKFARIAHQRAHSLQLQERLVHQIADDVQAFTDTDNVAVLAQGQHLCMIMRGIQTPATMTTSVMRGQYREEPLVRAEFLRLVGQAHANH